MSEWSVVALVANKEIQLPVHAVSGVTNAAQNLVTTQKLKEKRIIALVEIITILIEERDAD